MRLLLFTGATGAGSSRSAATTAVEAARRGVKTVLVTGGEPEDPRWLLDLNEPGLTLVRADPPQPDHAAVAMQLGMDPVPALLLAAVPGLSETLRWLAVPDLAGREPADLMVADLGTSESAARLLAAPSGLRACLDHLLPVGRRVHRAMSLRADPVTEAIDLLRVRLAMLDDLLLAPRTSVRFVVGPSATDRGRGRRWLPWLCAYGCRVEWQDAADTALDADAVLEGSTAPQPRRLVADGGDYRMDLSLPLARRNEVALHRVDDDLVLDASGGYLAPAVIALPSVLRRCRVTGAVLEGADGPDAVLQVRFARDLDLWPAAWGHR